MTKIMILGRVFLIVLAIVFFGKDFLTVVTQAFITNPERMV